MFLTVVIDSNLDCKFKTSIRERKKWITIFKFI